ncbi:hypothetical protein GA417_10130 [Poseidonibacter ostreae]|uniref:hypothetical protein n=1 Tax=Poseidonibacter ostreae TaxID=2654171 RepID=UPI001264455F|nr:hypothetical protein [Poseidonibacter ostreae]KAB7884901.1 hypothetical protein GA417_10130 [Poseidonibacter ostreae]
MDSKKRIGNKYVKDISIMNINKNTKTQIVWSITKFISSFLWCSTTFVVKNTPTALGMAWEVKKEISNAIADEIQELRKEQKQIALEEKILQLNVTKRNDAK